MDEKLIKIMYGALPHSVRAQFTMEQYIALPEIVREHLTPVTYKEYIASIDDRDEFWWDETDDPEDSKNCRGEVVCLAQAMKKVKELEAEKEQLIGYENKYCRVSYKEGEEKMKSDYDYIVLHDEIRDIDGRIVSIKHKLAKANCIVPVEPFGCTIGEALVYLAQLQNAKAQAERLAGQRQSERRITYNGVVEYTDCAYDVKVAKQELRKLRDTIASLQIAIDRANLTNFVKI